MLRILTILMIVAVLTLSSAPVLKTGQTTVYAEYDDGHYQTGVARSYSRSGDVVRDNVTGLEWQDNEKVVEKWSYAISYCSALPLDNGGWRLPTIEELETLVDDGRDKPSTTEGVFHHIFSSHYWSSTTDVEDTDRAWYVGFNDGRSYIRVKTVNYYVRCVRGGQ